MKSFFELNKQVFNNLNTDCHCKNIKEPSKEIDRFKRGKPVFHIPKINSRNIKRKILKDIRPLIKRKKLVEVRPLNYTETNFKKNATSSMRTTKYLGDNIKKTKIKGNKNLKVRYRKRPLKTRRKLNNKETIKKMFSRKNILPKNYSKKLEKDTLKKENITLPNALIPNLSNKTHNLVISKVPLPNYGFIKDKKLIDMLNYESRRRSNVTLPERFDKKRKIKRQRTKNLRGKVNLNKKDFSKSKYENKNKVTTIKPKIKKVLMKYAVTTVSPTDYNSNYGYEHQIPDEDDHYAESINSQITVDSSAGKNKIKNLLEKTQNYKDKNNNDRPGKVTTVTFHTSRSSWRSSEERHRSKIFKNLPHYESILVSKKESNYQQ